MTNPDLEQVVRMEWANYAAQENLLAVTPSAHLAMREDLIITSTRLFPTPEVNHACLLRADDATADALIEEVVAYFKSRHLPACVAISPACTPDSLPERLIRRGFKKRPEQEAWIATDMRYREIPTPTDKVEVREVTKREIWPFAKTYLASFHMPVILTPLLALLLRPTVGLPNIHYYIAWVAGKPVGACLWYSYEDIGCLGAMGVLPSQRHFRAATALTVKTGLDAKERGVNILMLQTVNKKLERFLHMSGFRTVFTRTRYVL